MIKQKDFVLEKGSLVLPVMVFTLGICMCEGVGEDSGYGHDDISCMTYGHSCRHFIEMCLIVYS